MRRQWPRDQADGLPPCSQLRYGENLLQCVQAVVSACGEDGQGCGLQLMQVLVTVMALPGASGLGDQVSLLVTPLGFMGGNAHLRQMGSRL